MLNIIKEAKPKVIFNLAGQTDVHSSFIIPKATTEVNSIGFINILEALKILGWVGPEVGVRIILENKGFSDL